MDDAQRFNRLAELFEEACGLSGSERAAFVARVADEAMRTELVEMLALDATHADSIRPIVDIVGALDGSRGPLEIPESIAGHRVEAVIGYGATGVVLRARQAGTERTVALKVLGAGAWNPGALSRFRREIRLLGQLDHPGIARIYDAGTDTTCVPARPYFVMEFVEGETFGAWRRARRRTPREVVAAIREVVDALAYAHARGIVHRDVKPGNVMIDRVGRARVLDFGVASAASPQAGLEADPLSQLTRTLSLTRGRGNPSSARSTGRSQDANAASATLGGATASGAVLGTIPYMSPEQFVGAAAVDARSDLYSVGVVLYEALVDQLPFPTDRMTLVEAAATIRDGEPSTIGRHDRALRGDLEAIVARLLEKEPSRRYQSAVELSDDLGRFLAGEPTRTRPASPFARARRFVRRYRGLFAATTAVFAVLVAFLAYTFALWRVAEDRGDLLAEALESSRATEYRRAIHYADAVLRAGNVRDARVALAATDESRRGWEWRYLMNRAGTESRVVRFPDILVAIDRRGGTTVFGDIRGDTFLMTREHPAPRLVARHGRTLQGIAVRPDGGAFALADASEPTIVVHDAADGGVARIFDSGLDVVSAVDWSDDGARLACGGLDGSASILDARTGEVVASIGRRAREGGRSREGLAVFLPGTHRVVAAGRSSRVLRNFGASGDSGDAPHEFDLGEIVESLSAIATVRGPRALVGLFDGRLLLLDPETGVVERALEAHAGPLRAIAPLGEGVLAGGARCATGGSDGRIHLWNIETGASVGHAVGAELHVRDLAVDAEEGALYAVGDDRALRRWDLARHALEPVLAAHRAWVYGLAFLADGTLVSASGEAPETDGRVIAWDADGRRPRWQWKFGEPAYANLVWKVVPDPLGGLVAITGKGFHFVESADGASPAATSRMLERFPFDVAILDGGEAIALLEFGAREVAVYGRDGRRRAAFPLAGDPRFGAITTGRDDRELLVARGDELLVLAWRPDGGDGGSLEEIRRIALRRDGRNIAFARRDAGREGRDGRREDGGELVAVGLAGGGVQLFDLARPEGAEERWHAIANPGEQARVALAPDGSLLATGGTGPGVLLWDAQTGEHVLTLDGHGDTVLSLAFSPDGGTLASGSIDGTVRLWIASSKPEHAVVAADAIDRASRHPRATREAGGER
ncbi:MAG: Serine/threonine-protein kinase PrkC [Planctomycetota bacterium]